MTSPEEIELKTFSVTLRGFDQAEVSAFLARVADEYRRLLADLENAGVADRADAPAPPVFAEGSRATPDDAFSDLAADINSVLGAAHQAAEQMRTRAAEEADQMRAEASRLRSEADGVRAEAERLRAEAEEARWAATTLSQEAIAVRAEAQREREEAGQLFGEARLAAEAAVSGGQLDVEEAAAAIAAAVGELLGETAELAQLSAALHEDFARAIREPLARIETLSHRGEASGPEHDGASPAAS